MLQRAGKTARQAAASRLAQILASHPSARYQILLHSTSANDASPAKLPPSPSLADFVHQAAMAQAVASGAAVSMPPLEQPLIGLDAATGQPLEGTTKLNSTSSQRRVYIETYGCQMNVNDTEVLLSVLRQAGYVQHDDPMTADLVLVNTCAIRDNAEQRVWSRLGYFKHCKEQRQQQGRPAPVVGVLGCMAERLKTKLLECERLVDLVVGPDAYRSLPSLVQGLQQAREDDVKTRHTAINVQLSLEETYADITPLRPAGTHRAFLSIMRGCDNMCSFCIVPFTRGRERSRPLASILEEVKQLSDAGCREVTLLGQNVNSYADRSRSGGVLQQQGVGGGQEGGGVQMEGTGGVEGFGTYAKGFRSVYRPDVRRAGTVSFAELLARVAEIDPELRVRFTSPHPKDFSDDVLQVIASYPNVCQQLHMPAQSGSSSCLERMKRGYTREAYLELVQRVRAVLQPQVALSTDIIAGFCGETEQEHEETVRLMELMQYEQAFMFKYSLREKTHAARHYEDDVPEDVKSRRLQEIIETFRVGLAAKNAQEIGHRHVVMIDGPSKRSDGMWTGRTCTNKRVLLRDVPVPATYAALGSSGPTVQLQVGDYVAVEVTGVGGGGLLLGDALARTTLQQFVREHGSTVPVTTPPYHSTASLLQPIVFDGESLC